MPNANPVPHYLRFARALAFVSGLAGAGCGAAVAPLGDAEPDSATDVVTVADADRVDAGPVDASPVDDAGEADGDLADAVSPDSGRQNACTDCSCNFGGDTADSGLPACPTGPPHYCCAAVGPVAPPDLPGLA